MKVLCLVIMNVNVTKNMYHSDRNVKYDRLSDYQVRFYQALNTQQGNHAIAKMTARCAQYVSALKIVGLCKRKISRRLRKNLHITIRWCGEIIGLRALSFKRPLLSVDVEFCLSVCLFVCLSGGYKRCVDAHQPVRGHCTDDA